MREMKIENWKLILLSVFYVVFACISYMIEKEKFLTFFFIAGIVLAVIGLLQVCTYFLKKDYLKPNEFGFSFGVLGIMIGLILACKPGIIVDNYPIVISGVVVLDSTLRMQYAMNLCRLQDKQWKVNLIFSVIPWGIGLLVMLYPMQEDTLQNVFSMLLLLDAVANIYTVLYYKRIVRRYGYRGNQILDIASQEQIQSKN